LKTAAAYIRVSTDDQLEFSPDSQLKKLREYAEAHELLLSDANVYSDEGISGRSAQKRPGFMRMIAAAKQLPRPFDVILVWKFSRFARSRQDSIFYKSMLRRECGVEVISITEQLSDDPTSILVEALLEAMDEYYSINLAQEVRRGMNEKFSRGGVVSVPPFGYKMQDGHFVPDGENAAAVQYIFSSRLGGCSPRNIAAVLNTLGICTSRGLPFETRAIDYILSNPTYTGKLRKRTPEHKKGDRCYTSGIVLADGEHQALVSEEDFRLVQDLRGRGTAEHAAYAEGKEFMLRSLVRCTDCGSALTLASKGRGLQCCGYARGQCSRSHYISLRRLDSAVLAQLAADLRGGVIAAAPLCRIEERAASDVMLSKARRRLERLKAAYSAGADTLEEYVVAKSKLESEINRLQNEHSAISELPVLRISLPELISALYNPGISEGIKNRILRSFIARINFYRPGDAIEIIYRA
jgi:site-specific DNA recombinase